MKTLFETKVFNPNFLKKDFSEIQEFIFKKIKDNLLKKLSIKERGLLETKHSLSIDPNEEKITLTLLDRLFFECVRYSPYFHLTKTLECSLYIYDCKKMTSVEVDELVPLISRIEDKWKGLIKIKTKFKPSQGFGVNGNENKLYLDFKIL